MILAAPIVVSFSTVVKKSASSLTARFTGSVIIAAVENLQLVLAIFTV